MRKGKENSRLKRVLAVSWFRKANENSRLKRVLAVSWLRKANANSRLKRVLIVRGITKGTENSRLKLVSSCFSLCTFPSILGCNIPPSPNLLVYQSRSVIHEKKSYLKSKKNINIYLTPFII